MTTLRIGGAGGSGTGSAGLAATTGAGAWAATGCASGTGAAGTGVFHCWCNREPCDGRFGSGRDRSRSGFHRSSRLRSRSRRGDRRLQRCRCFSRMCRSRRGRSWRLLRPRRLREAQLRPPDAPELLLQGALGYDGPDGRLTRDGTSRGWGRNDRRRLPYGRHNLSGFRTRVCAAGGGVAATTGEAALTGAVCATTGCRA